MTEEMKAYQKNYRVYNEDIIDLIISISANMQVDTYEKGVLVELLKIRKTPVKYTTDGFIKPERCFERWLEERN
jgi:hypothetical protein